MGQIFIKFKCDQSWKGQPIPLMWKDNIIRKGKNCLPILMKGWLEGTK
jgi:hypothetical protein